MAEDAGTGTAVGAPVEATDLNAGDSAVNDPLAYSLSGTNTASFTIDGSTGQLRVASGVQLDYEGKRSYRVTVSVTDGRDHLGDDDMGAIDARRNVTINVNDVNEAPVVTGDAAPSVQENSDRAVATFTAKDPERDTLTWTVSGNDFWVSDRGQLYFRTPPSFEGQTTYSATVAATDDDATAPLSGSLDVTVTVTDIEERGVVTLSPPRGWDGTGFTAELADGDGVTGSIIWRWERSSNRSSWTAIPGATSSSYTATVDDVNQYLRVTASYDDGRGAGKDAEARLSGRIGAVDDRPVTNTAPEFAEATPTRSIREGTAAGRSIGARVPATDPDAGEVLTYSLSGQDARLFDIDPATGQLRTKAVLDYDPDPQAENTYTVTVNVHDGFDANYDPSTAPDATIDVTITLTAASAVTPPSGGGGGGGGGAPSNRSPSFADGAATTRSVAENTAAGQDIGAPLAAVDPDRGDTLTYTLGGTDAASFDIVAATGQLQTKAALDAATKSSYTVTVTATDTAGANDTITVTITVNTSTLGPLGDRYDANGNRKGRR